MATKTTVTETITCDYCGNEMTREGPIEVTLEHTSSEARGVRIAFAAFGCGLRNVTDVCCECRKKAMQEALTKAGL